MLRGLNKLITTLGQFLNTAFLVQHFFQQTRYAYELSFNVYRAFGCSNVQI